jgi:hypothetical protein
MEQSIIFSLIVGNGEKNLEDILELIAAWRYQKNPGTATF